MPSAEFLKSKNAHYDNSVSGHLGVFLLFVCPSCKRYTVHKPRLNQHGFWYVDHQLVPVYQMSFDGKKEFAGLTTVDSCFIENNNAIESIELTRTVIRVN